MAKSGEKMEQKSDMLQEINEICELALKVKQGVQMKVQA